MREGELLQRIYARSADLPSLFPQVLVGPGDDCAVVAVGDGAILLKVDQVVEGRHFSSQTPVDLVARKAIARAVSDIAAMAGRPSAAVVGAVLPPGFPQAGADQLYDALLRWSSHFGCPLVGGDTAVFGAGPGGSLTLSVSIIGVPHRARGPVLRSGARVGDGVFVTGTIGGSLDHSGPFPGGGRHLTFEPRLREAAWLADRLGSHLHAMMDVSDGLGIDAGRLAERSGVAVELEGQRVPLSKGCGDVLRACADGEDYELLFTAPLHAGVPSEVAGTPVSLIGRVMEFCGGARSVMVLDGRRVPADTMGWEHAG
ncbi:MAG: thiamine-phosphate kinase [Phycisphaerales bacterium]